MHIFSKRKQQEPELALVQVQEERKYDFWAALAKALLLFLLVYGTLGGFLSAFEIEYNSGVCMLVLFLLALFLSAVYETGKKWLTNLCSLGLFAVYMYVALTNYWVINSGYYAILNKIFAIARSYLGVQNGTEYDLVVQDEYMTITAFVLFMGMVALILFNIYLQRKCSLFRVVSDTLVFFVVPFYFERSPSMIYVLFLLTGYMTAAILQGGNVKSSRMGDRLTRRMRYVIPLAAVMTVLLVRGVSFLLPEQVYTGIVPDNAVKVSTGHQMSNLLQFGLRALFRTDDMGAGISGGMLSRGSSVMPSYETDLIVRYTPYSFDPVYLKAFTGRDYEGMRWTAAEAGLPDDGLMEETVRSRQAAYERDASKQGRGVMEIRRVGASYDYEYRPYYTMDTPGILHWVSARFGPDVEPDPTRNFYPAGEIYDVYTYYPASGEARLAAGAAGQADEAYLTVPESCARAVRNVCEAAGFAGTEEEIADQVVKYFAENYSYTLRPGYYFGNSDYITHFLTENKKGYCAHFASAGTMLFRQMGIPARYVEGYAFSYTDVVLNGVLVEDAAYEEYYDGYAPLGETALVELEIPDAYAHAWVEIYVADKGWVVVDPTPAASEEEDTTSFWDAFMNLSGENTELNLGTGNLGAYLENALGGMTYVLLLAALLTAAVLTIVKIRRIRKERRLPGAEQVRLEYGRILRILRKKDENYGALRTLQDQLNRLREGYGLEIGPEQEQALYQVFFAGETDYDCGRLRRELRRIRALFRHRRRKKK
ncbi:MAG: transglutaminase-like domain-containing protein [Muribaculum sp.]|nr:transglutaminase-like domain-containing protein [Muribaculum sp.]